MKQAIIFVILLTTASLAFAGVGKNEVRSIHIKNGQVKSQDIGNGQVRSQDIGNGQVRTHDIRDGDVKSRDIRDGGVKNIDLADDAVSTDKIQDRAVAPSKLSICLPQMAHVSGNQSETVTEGSTETVRFLELTAPCDGQILVQSTAGVFAGTGVSARCTISDTAVLNPFFNQIFLASSASDLGMLAGQRVFDVTEEQTITVNLLCTGTNGNPTIFDSTLTATFYSNIPSLRPLGVKVNPGVVSPQASPEEEAARAIK